ncbi:MAG: hypothetical protein WD794_04655 [Mycobacteriales bacterium]
MRRATLLALSALLAALLSPAAPASAAQYADTAALELASPALVEPRPGVLEVYTRAPGGTPQRQVRDEAGRWSRTTSLGGTITSKPAAVSMTAGRTDVFARGGSGQLVQKYAVDGRWSPWIHLGGRFAGAPTVVSWAPGRLDVFARGTDGTLLHTWFAGGRWFAWERLGGSLASAPAAVSMVPGRLDVFARGTNGALVHLYYPGGGWSRWSSLGGTLYSEPAAVTTGDGRLDVLVRGGDGALRLKSFVRGTGWSGYSTLPGAVRSGPGAVVTSTGETVVVARDPQGRYVLRSRPADGAWSLWTALGGVSVFHGLGAWVDLYDYASLDRAAALDDLRSRGVRTVYLQTSRFSASFDLSPDAVQWVDAAHARGISAVGWYLPGYGDMARDLRRTMVIADVVTPAGGRFDAVGVDIEAHTGIGSSNEVPRTTMNSRAVEHLRQVRARTNAPLTAITPQPTATDEAGETWEGFPWKGVGQSADLVLPMSYWPKTCRDACVRDYTATNARYAASWTGRPVHIAGRGYPAADGTQVSDSDIRAYVDGAVAAGVVGGSVYDYASTRTRTAWWSSLARLNKL